MTTDQKATGPQTVAHKANASQPPDRAQPSSQASGWGWGHFTSGVVTTLIGSFAGAGFAFLANWISQRRIEKRDNTTAGRLALLTIRAQWDDFTNYRWGIFSAVANLYAQIGQNAPEWALAKPMAVNFSDSNAFKFESLGFLLSTSTGRDAFQKLQHLERTYFDLSARHVDFNAATQELQRSVATLQMGVANAERLSYADLERHIGPELLTRVIDFQRAVVLRADRDEDRYKAAFESLNDAMVERYGEKVRMAEFTIPHGFKKEELQALPLALRTYLDKIPVARE